MLVMEDFELEDDVTILEHGCHGEAVLFWLVTSDEGLISAYYGLEQIWFLDNSGSVFNCDEVGLPLNHTPSVVIGIK